MDMTFFSRLKITNLVNDFFGEYYKTSPNHSHLLIIIKKVRYFRAAMSWSKTTSLVQEILIVLFRSQIEAKKSSRETELESHCNSMVIKVLKLSFQ